MRENRPSGLMRGGKITVIGTCLSIRRFLPTLHILIKFALKTAYFAQSKLPLFKCIDLFRAGGPLQSLLKSPANIRAAMILKEVLGPPKSLEGTPGISGFL